MKELMFYLIFFNPSSGYGTTPVNLGAYETQQHCELAKLEVARLGARNYENKMKCIQFKGVVK